ncbi:MAG: hypothetical protein K6B72_06270 [Lachnospiraceae bacterium]|nr:hypothetical protein [Lachnospiraceae bacterium]
MFVRSIVPFAYAVLLGCVWGAWFKKKFSGSLALAFMTHILLVLLSGLVFRRLSPGVYGGIAAAAAAGAVLIFRNRSRITKQTIREYLGKQWDEGVWIFTLFYVFCILMNIGKRFVTWDEFTHWGIFLKESLRLDSLYCMSPLNFDHKDYVPAFTLFEVIWSRLNGRFSEPDAYRAIQVFMFSLLMPVFERGSARKRRLSELGAVLLVLLVPLFFNIDNGFCFYHSIYCDLAVGILFFWCVFEAYRSRESLSYQLLALTIGLSVLVLAKMTSMALLPLIIALFIVRLLLFSGEKLRPKQWAFSVLTIAVPVGLWFWFNRFAAGYVENTSGSQSYGGMRLSSLRDVFTSPGNSSIPYLKGVRDAFVDALLHRDILLHGSYVAVILAAAIAFFILSRFAEDGAERKKRVLAGLWTIGAGIYYALLMYFLYCTVFNEYEALRLASYERYMNSFVIAAVFLLVAVYLDSEIPEKHSRGYCCLLLIVFLDLAFFHAKAFDQALPGSFTHDEETVSDFLAHADAITAAMGEEESMFIVRRGDNGEFLCHERYYCSPRTLGGGSIGPVVDEADLWSSDKTPEEFMDKLRGYDYIYFSLLDDAFLERYAGIFSDPELLTDGSICRITGIDTLVHLE